MTDEIIITRQYPEETVPVRMTDTTFLSYESARKHLESHLYTLSCVYGGTGYTANRDRTRYEYLESGRVACIFRLSPA